MSTLFLKSDNECGEKIQSRSGGEAGRELQMLERVTMFHPKNEWNMQHVPKVNLSFKWLLLRHEETDNNNTTKRGFNPSSTYSFPVSFGKISHYSYTGNKGKSP